MKKTKIISSIGPATQSWEKFKGIVEAGMNVARINFSHGGYEENEVKIAELEDKIRHAKIIDESEIDTKTVQIGNTVKVLDIEFNEEVEYTIVGSTEVDLAENKISNESPLGKALLGAKRKHTVEVNAPAGIMKYKILDIKK